MSGPISPYMIPVILLWIGSVFAHTDDGPIAEAGSTRHLHSLRADLPATYGAAAALPNLTLLQTPTDASAELDETVEFGVLASGVEPLRYRWFLNGDPLEHEGPWLILNRVDRLDAGSYTVEMSMMWNQDSTPRSPLIVSRKSPRIRAEAHSTRATE